MVGSENWTTILHFVDPHSLESVTTISVKEFFSVHFSPSDSRLILHHYLAMFTSLSLPVSPALSSLLSPESAPLLRCILSQYPSWIHSGVASGGNLLEVGLACGEAEIVSVIEETQSRLTRPATKS